MNIADDSSGDRTTTGPLDAWAILALGLALAALCGRWVRPGFVIAQIDISPMPHPLTLLWKTLFAWGTMTSPFGAYGIPTFAPYYVLVASANRLFGESVAQVAVVWFFLFSGSTGVFLLARRLAFGRSAASIAAIVYVLTPYTLYLVVWTTGSALFATLPWVVLGLLTAGNDESQRSRIRLLGMVFSAFAFPTIASTPPLFFELFLGAVVVTIVLLFKSPGPSRARFARWLVPSIVVWFAASIWWLVPTLIAIGTQRVAHSSNVAGSLVLFSRASLLNALRLNTAWTWGSPYYLPFSIAYDQNPYLYASGFMPSTFLAVALACAPRRRRRLTAVVALCALAGLFVAKGTHAPFGFLNDALYRVPGGFLLLEPGGLFIGAAFGFAICAAVVTESLPRRRVFVTGLAAFAVLVGATSITPLLDGGYFHNAAGGAPPWYVRVPSYWGAARSRLGSTPLAPTLVLPSNYHYQAAYTWGFKGVDILPPGEFEEPTLTLGPSLTYLAEERTSAIDDALARLLRIQSPAFLPTLRHLGFRYVICRDDVIPATFNDCLDGTVARLLSTVPHTRDGLLTSYDLGTSDRFALTSSATFSGDPNASVTLANGAPRLATTEPMSGGMLVGDGPSVRVVAEPLVTIVEVAPNAIAALNPAIHALETDVVVGPLPEPPRRASLIVGTKTIDGTIDLRTRAVTFRHATIAPGRSVLQFTGFDELSPAAWPTLLRFTHRTSPETIVARSRREVAVAAKSAIHLLVTGVATHTSLLEEPIVFLTSPAHPGTTLGVVLTVSTGNRRFACDVSTIYATTIAVRDSVSLCLDQNGIVVDVRTLTVERIDIDYIAQAATLGSTALPDGVRIKLRLDARRSVAKKRSHGQALGYASFGTTTERTLPIFASVPMALVDVVSRPSERRTLVMRSLYEPTWLAIRLNPRPILLHHRQVDGWRNAWDVDGDGTIVTIELISTIEIVALACTTIAIVVAILRRTRTSRA